jgi:predicted esterase
MVFSKRSLFALATTLLLSGVSPVGARAEVLLSASDLRRSPEPIAHEASAPPAVEITFLHGNGERPEGGCAALREVLKSAGWTHCPRGNLPFGAGFTWGADTKSMVDRLTFAEASRASKPEDAALPKQRLLLAFSQGGYVAPRIVTARPGWYSSILVIAATATYSKASLEALGVRRIGFAAGRWDSTYETMKKNASDLARAGFEARFYDLGPVGHTYLPKNPAELVPIVTWLTASPAAPTSTPTTPSTLPAAEHATK